MRVLHEPGVVDDSSCHMQLIGSGSGSVKRGCGRTRVTRPADPDGFEVYVTEFLESRTAAAAVVGPDRSTSAPTGNAFS